MGRAAAYGPMLGCSLAAGLGLCSCSPSAPLSAPMSAPANESFIQPSAAMASGLTIDPSRPLGAAAAGLAGAYGADEASARPDPHSSTDGERG